MISLKNVSKFYYNKGIIASGFSKVSVDFKLGEFVAITGESGSGKSTLLNVISGLDSYEEGEMYINGKETSHYSEKDFEDYRRKYIGNIFQNFNLVNSYTVYQNIELVLLLNGENKKDIKNKVLELIKKVNLYKFRNTKVSKLSGGQKQRVAIARALAKDTPIIIADEPTGSLDVKSANEILKLLSSITKDKLVIIVTHNYEQVEPYVTRKIKMHDGKILEDDVLKKTEEVKESSAAKYDNITNFNKLRLGIRNSYNIIPKFLLLLAVYLFITISVVAEYASFKKEEDIASKSAYNYFYQNTSDTRLIIKKNDKTSFTEEEYNKISKLSNVKELVRNDLLNDLNVSLTDDSEFWISATVTNANKLKKVDKGRVPEEDNEIVLEGSKSNYFLNENYFQLLDKEVFLSDFNGVTNKDKSYKIVGVKYNEKYNTMNEADFNVFALDSFMKKVEQQINQKYSNLKVNFNGKNYKVGESLEFDIKTNSRVPEGYVYMAESMNVLCPKEKCIDNDLKIKVDNVYYNDEINLKVNKLYTKKTLKGLLGIDNFDEINGNIFINPNDLDKLYNKDPYQSGIFVKDKKKIDETIDELKKMDLTVLKISDVLYKDNTTRIVQMVKTIITIGLLISLFFIIYFVITIILKSRNVYYSIIRMLGATKQVSKDLLIIELLTVSNMAYFGFTGYTLINHFFFNESSLTNKVMTYLTVKDFVYLYIIIILLSFLISLRYARKLFKKSAISTMGEEV